LTAGRWDHLKDTDADRVIDTLAQYAPNIKEIILNRQVVSPLDLERAFALTSGDIFHGEMILDRRFLVRPVPGLYLCGAGAHPGDGVVGAPGYNAAREILRDRARGSPSR